LSDASHTPGPGAARMRLALERRRSGLRVVPVELRAVEIAALVRLGYLPPDVSTGSAIGAALGALLDRLPPPDRWPGAAVTGLFVI
jgi:hypothetical protein